MKGKNSQQKNKLIIRLHCQNARPRLKRSYYWIVVHVKKSFITRRWKIVNVQDHFKEWSEIYNYFYFFTTTNGSRRFRTLFLRWSKRLKTIENIKLLTTKVVIKSDHTFI